MPDGNEQQTQQTQDSDVNSKQDSGDNKQANQLTDAAGGGSSAKDPAATAQGNEGAGAGEGSTEGGSEAQDAKPAADTRPKTPPWFQRRIDQLTLEKNNERRQVDAYKNQIDALVGQLAEMNASKDGGETPAPAAPAAAQPVAAPRQVAPVGPTQEQLEAMVEKRAGEKARERVITDACNKAYDEGLKAYDDFDESMKTFGLLGGLPAHVLELMPELPNPHRVLYELGKNPDEAERILRMSPTRAAMELVRFEAQTSAPKPRQVSGAPAPIQPLNTAGQRAETDLEKASMNDFIRIREKHLSERRAR